MLIQTSDLVKFIELCGIGIGGFFEAHNDKFLCANVGNTVNTVLIEAEMDTKSDEQLDFYFIRETALKYLKNFKGSVTITSNQDVISVSDGKLTVFIPQAAIDSSKQNTRMLKREFPPIESTATLNVADISKILSVARNIEESVICVTINEGSVTFNTGKKADYTVEAKTTGKPRTIYFRDDTFDILSKAEHDVFIEVTDNPDAPMKFTFTTGNIGIKGYIAPFVAEEPETEE